jgi:hypothetical protein
MARENITGEKSRTRGFNDLQVLNSVHYAPRSYSRPRFSLFYTILLLIGSALLCYAQRRSLNNLKGWCMARENITAKKSRTRGFNDLQVLNSVRYAPRSYSRPRFSLFYTIPSTDWICTSLLRAMAKMKLQTENAIGLGIVVLNILCLIILIAALQQH